MNAPIRNLAGLTILVTLVTLPARADYELFWFTIDGGGAAALTGDGFELSTTVGQPDAGSAGGDALELVGGFWPGTVSAANCSGAERISKARCGERNASNLLKVILAAGVEGDAFTVTLSDGSTKSGVCNRRGKGKAKFNNRPAGDAGTATAEWGCGATDDASYVCP
ncbi:MAG: hypothetical protein IT449_16110 [Phycisphaerales bacterium]|nr:hypothetical protein [Phycisphaerales bacterium]